LRNQMPCLRKIASCHGELTCRVLTQDFLLMARRAPERMKEHTVVCECMSVKRNAASSKKDQLKGAIAQLGERLPCMKEVSGSITLGSTSFRFATEFIHESFD